MKNIVTLLIGILFFSASFAQEEEVIKDPKAQEKIKAARIAFITDRLGLTPDEAEKFWPVYREFSMKRMDLKKQFDQRRNTPDPAKTTDQNEKDNIDFGLQLRQKELDLEKEYSSKLLNVVPPQKVMALRGAEDDFRKLVIKQIQHRQNMQKQREQQRNNNEQRLKQRNN